MTFFTFLWAIYNFFIRPTDINKPHLLGGTLFDYPFYVPMIDRNGKLVQEFSFDKWALIHIIIYLIFIYHYSDLLHGWLDYAKK